MSVTIETSEQNLEPRYAVLIRSGAILGMVLVTSMNDAGRLTKSYEPTPEVDTEVIRLPATAEQQQDLSDFLGSLTRKVTHVRIEDTIQMSATLETKVTPRHGE